MRELPSQACKPEQLHSSEAPNRISAWLFLVSRLGRLHLQVVGATGDNGAEPCLAISSPRQGTYTVALLLPGSSTPADASTPGGGRRLLAKGGATSTWSSDDPNNEVTISSAMWGGYEIHEEISELKDFRDDATERERWLGGSSGANRVVGGLMLHQTRSGLDKGTCSSPFADLSAGCAELRMYERYSQCLGRKFDRCGV